MKLCTVGGEEDEKSFDPAFARHIDETLRPRRLMVLPHPEETQVPEMQESQRAACASAIVDSLQPVVMLEPLSSPPEFADGEL